jgi:hypothetical protein
LVVGFVAGFVVLFTVVPLLCTPVLKFDAVPLLFVPYVAVVPVVAAVPP